MKAKIYISLGALFVLWIFPTLTIANDCYKSTIVSPSPFLGNNGEIFKLADGSLWEVKYEYEYLYEYYPSVVICPNQGRLIIGSKSLNVRLVSNSSNSTNGDSRQSGGWELYEETYLKGIINGVVRNGTILKTISGNVYEVTGITVQVVVEVQPDVVVLKKGEIYKLIVDGFDEPLLCKCLICTTNNKD